MRKVLSLEEIELVRLDLLNSKSTKRRGAAKKIGKYHIKELEEQLLEAYTKEQTDSRTWETQVEMIRALGKIGATFATKIIENVMRNPQSDGARTSVATTAYIRLVRMDNDDAQPIVDMLAEDINISVINGLFDALLFDDMRPQIEQVDKIIDFAEQHEDYFESIWSKGTTDAREKLLSASVNWDRSNERLISYIDNAKDNPHINRFIECILKGEKAPFGE